MSHQAAMNKLLKMMNISDLEKQKQIDLKKGILTGYGIISMCEVTNPSPLFYGAGGAHISSHRAEGLRNSPHCFTVPSSGRHPKRALPVVYTTCFIKALSTYVPICFPSTYELYGTVHTRILINSLIQWKSEDMT